MQSTQQPLTTVRLSKVVNISPIQSRIDSQILAFVLEALIQVDDSNPATQNTRTDNEQNGEDKKWRKMITHLRMKKSNQKCTVCLESFNEGEVIKQLPCKHILHRECGKEWLKKNRRCPICRLDVEAHFRECDKKVIEN